MFRTGAARRAATSWRLLQWEHPARAEDAVRIEGVFKPAHQRDLRRLATVPQVRALLETDAVLSRDRAAVRGEVAVDDLLDEWLLLHRRFAGQYGEVHVAVAEMTEDHEIDVGPMRPQVVLDAPDVLGDVPGGQADIEAEQWMDPQCLGRDSFPHPPQLAYVRRLLADRRLLDQLVT